MLTPLKDIFCENVKLELTGSVRGKLIQNHIGICNNANYPKVIQPWNITVSNSKTHGLLHMSTQW